MIKAAILVGLTLLLAAVVSAQYPWSPRPTYDLVTSGTLMTLDAAGKPGQLTIVGKVRMYPGATKLPNPGGILVGTLNGTINDPSGKDAVKVEVRLYRSK